jgi:hypothetical protein
VTKEMALNLISVFVRWLRQILCIGLRKEFPAEGLREREQVEVPLSPVKRSIETFQPEQPEEKPAGTPELEQKIIGPTQQKEGPGQEEVEGKAGSEETSIKTLQSEENPIDITEPEEKIIEFPQYGEEASGEEGQEQESGGGAQEISIETVQAGEKPIDFSEREDTTSEPTQYEEVTGEKEDGGKLKKPYRKKAPTEESKGEPIRPPDIKKKPSAPEKREPIFLGDLPKRGRRLTKEKPKSKGSQDTERETADKRTEEERIGTDIESPFVEIDLDNASVCLVLPQQESKSDLSSKSPLIYAVGLNGKSIDIPASIMSGREGHLFVEEKGILLEEPLVEFKVVFPEELQAREYNYSHKSREVYPFIAIGNNRGRFYFLNDGDGNVNPLPGREMWILLQEDFELQTEPEVTEEKWIWEEYQPLRVNLAEVEGLIIKNRKSGKQKKLFSESAFRVEGDGLVEDDFKKECPLFTGKVLQIFAPHENQSGWNVWILHRQVGARIVCKDWTGGDCLALRLPEDLPCEFGEFQIDICQGNIRVPEETLFFRLMPPIKLDYPKALIIPDPKTGHSPSVVSIRIDSGDEWELKQKEGGQSESTGRNFHQIEPESCVKTMD